MIIHVWRNSCFLIFLAAKPKDDKAVPKEFEDTMHYVYYDDGKPIAGGDVITLETNLRGMIVKNAGIENVCCFPEGRRKGHVREIIQNMFVACEMDGIPISTLYPFKASYYDQFGYVAIGGSSSILFGASCLRNYLKFSDETLSIERTQSSEVSIDEYMDLVSKVQKTTHGFSSAPKSICEFDFKNDSSCLVVRRSKILVGIMKFNQRDPVSRKIFSIDRKLLYLDENVRRAMLQFVALHIDSYESIRMELPPGRDAGHYLTDVNSKIEYSSMTIQMGRIMVMEKMTGIKLNSPDLKFTAQIRDSQCLWNNKTWNFEIKGGVLTVSEKEGLCDFWLDIRGISALVFGSIYDISEIQANKWGNPDSEMCKTFSTMFSYQIPVLFEKF